ncbi:MAG: EMC3/TMCO1 family protein [Promethearchaeota archaeon]
MANEEIIIGIMFITLAMIAVGELLNKFMGVNRDAAREMREKSKNLQERMRTAQLTGDAQIMLELQRESMELTKIMMKKQMIPSCIRCIIFMGLFAVFGTVYAGYVEGLLPFPILIFGSGWFAVYFLFSITFSLILYGIKRLYRKLTGKEVKRNKQSILGRVSPRSENSESIIQLTRQINEPIQKREYVDEQEDSWKNRVKK